MSLLSLAAGFYFRRMDRRLARAAADPAGSQNRTFQSLLRTAAGTWFGKEHDFRSIRTHADFVKAVPVADYVGRLDMFRRIRDGQADVSWPGRIKFFAQTSGTTAGDKHIPISSQMNKSNAAAALSIFAYYGRRGPGMIASVFDGKMLFLGGSTALTRIENGAMVGDLSGIATRSIRWPLTTRYEPGKDLALISSWEQKIQAVARRVESLDVRFVTGMPSWVKILFDHVCRLRGLPPEGGISRVWPNLRLFVHGGVNFAPFRPTFLKYFDPSHRLDFLEVYPASEGFIAIQDRADDPGMELLTDNGIFYEFVPLSEWGRPDATRLTIEQVRLDVPYSLVLNTNAGLWAYDIGDVVRFVSLRPPRIVFAGRNRHFINAFGENIIGEQVSAAVAAAAEACGAPVVEFTAAPRYPDKDHRVGAHQYVVEFHDPPADMAAFARAIDAELLRLNNDYSIKRRGDLGMTGVEVTAVPEGTFYNWMAKRGKLGGQHKVPVCANDRKYVDEILAGSAVARASRP
ncbi:MAG: GH3 auxin-responsive promoter family protein [Planctomycetes bacterium]|nr:GH3 auxin-responsive promoter family protein [Planctomycetota bacterium]